MNKERKNEMEKEDYLYNIGILCEKAKISAKGVEMYGHQINIENPDEVIAVFFTLYSQAKDVIDTTNQILELIKYSGGKE